MDEPEARRRFAAARRGVLATSRSDGGADLVPVTFALDGDRLVTLVDHKPKSTQRLQRLANVERSPMVTLLVDHYDDDWDQLWWVRVHGTARVVDEGPERDRAAAQIGRRYAQYEDREPTGPAIIVDVARWVWWSAL